MNPYGMPMIAPYLAQMYGQAPQNPYLQNLQIPQVNLRGQRMRMRAPEMDQPQQQAPQVPMPSNYDPNERVKNALGMEMSRGTMDMFSDIGAGLGQAYDNPFVQALSYADRARRARMGGDPEAQQRAFENQLALRQADREDAQASKIAWTKVTEYLGDGQEQDYLMDPNNPDNKKPFGKPRNVKVADLPADVLEYEYAKKEALSADPNAKFPSYMDYTMQLKRAGANNISIDNKAEGAGRKAQAEASADIWKQARVAAQSAYEAKAAIQQFRQAADGTPQGPVSSYSLPIRSALNELGLKDEDIPNQEALNAASASLVIADAKKLGANPTDRDVMLMERKSPTLAKTPGGNAIILNYGERAADRKIQEARWMSEYLASPDSGGILGAGWDDYLAKKQQENPLLTPDERKLLESVGQSKPQAGTKHPTIRNITVE